MFRLLVLFVISCLLSGCVSHVLFYDRVSADGLDDGSVKVHVDGLGDVYDEADVGLFYDEKRSRWLRCAHYLESCSQRGRVFEFNLSGTELNQWHKKQKERWDETANRILKAASPEGSGPDRPIVFLIHGFRVPDADFEYRVAKNRIRQVLPETIDPLFIEIHWDGRESGDPGAPRAWMKAQFSAPLVGLRLRYLFNRIQAEYLSAYGRPPTVRILTHSSGAIVAGSLIADAGGALPCFEAAKINKQEASCGSVYFQFKDARADTIYEDSALGVPDIPDLRIAMMAAATPATTFTGAEGTTNGKGVLSGVSPVTLIIGHNDKDIALNKVIGRASLFGDSSLGKSIAAYCRVERHISDRSRVYGIDMRRPTATLWGRTKHDFAIYLNDKGSQKMLELLFGTVNHSSDFAC